MACTYILLFYLANVTVQDLAIIDRTMKTALHQIIVKENVHQLVTSSALELYNRTMI